MAWGKRLLAGFASFPHRLGPRREPVTGTAGAAPLPPPAVEDAVVSLAPGGTIAGFNEAAEATFGWRRAEVLGRPLGDLVVWSDLPGGYGEALQALLDRGAGPAAGRWVEGVGRRADDSTFPLELAIVPSAPAAACPGPARGPAGRAAGFVAYLRDLSGRRRAAEALQRLARRNRTILESAGEGIFGLGPDGCVTFANPAAARMLGWEGDDLVGRHCDQILAPPDDNEQAPPADRRSSLLAVFGDGRVRAVAGESFRRRDGRAFAVEYVNTPIWEDGRFAGAVVVFNDVTARKLSERLEQDRRDVLARVARGEPLADVLASLARLLENQRPDLRTCVLIAHEAPDGGGGAAVWHAASIPPGLDPELVAALEGVFARVASPAAGPTVSDPARDPAWEGRRDVARRHRLGGCWSVPVFRRAEGVVADDGDVNPDAGRAAGLLVACLDRPLVPSPTDLELLNSAAGLASIALEHRALSDRLAWQEQVLAEQGVALAYRASHDPLTGLPNRDLLDDRVQQALARCARDGRGAALFLIETDGLRLINETLGHDAGDELLKEIAQRLQASARQGDLIARTGGDEFTYLAVDLKDRRGATVVAEKLLKLLTQPFAAGGRELFLTASLGGAVFPEDGPDLSALRRRADAALTWAKERGRNRYEFFAPEMADAGALERLEMEGHLRQAVGREELQLHYQPQVDGDGRVVAVEALVRWTHPKLGPIPPGKFIPIAEEGGLIVPIGRWVLREACRQTAAWRRDAALPPVRVAVNVSALQFAEPDFIATVESALRDAALAPEWLELEITESALMDKPEAVAEKLTRLRQMGVAVAIDDFGTGYSSLAYLHRLPIDTLKIDRSFVQAVDGDDPGTKPAGPPASAGSAPGGGGKVVILAIISLARSLGMKVLAEGVETQRQREFLVQHGCELMQGYLFSRPRPPSDLEAVLRDTPRVGQAKRVLAMSA